MANSTLSVLLKRTTIIVPIVISLSISIGWSQQKGKKTTPSKAVKELPAKQKTNKVPAVVPVPPVVSATPVVIEPPVVKFDLDLQKITQDQLEITCTPPKFNQESVVFRLPAMVPGTYHIYHFGRWISGVKALSKSGAVLPVSKLDDDSWKIEKADQLAKLIYRVSDSFDSTVKTDFPFEPAGSNIQIDTTVLLQTHCFFGYFDGFKNTPITINVKHNPTMYGATSLIDQDPNLGNDRFEIPNYVVLADHPVLYTAQADTVSMQLGATKVLISVYDEAGKIHAKDLLPRLQGMLQAASDFFGGRLPTNRYSFLLHYGKKPFLSGNAGALEHTTGSVYALPSTEPAEAASELVEIASHEFFHIITPLNIHSEQIGDFDFAKPAMSQHLWLYEGLTEYMSSYILLRQKVKTSKEYIAKLQYYTTYSTQYFNDTLPFTEMSLKVLGETEKQYSNVYLKGPLINLCLDVKMLQLSNGKYGMPQLIADLSAKYGKDRSFVDKDLFDEIIKITKMPELKSFFDTYVQGKKPLPLEETFKIIGVKLEKEVKKESFSFGKVNLKPNEKGMVEIIDVSNMSPTGKQLGYEVGDIVLSLNGNAVTYENLSSIIADWRSTVKVGDKMVVKVERKGEVKKLKTRAETITSVEKNIISLDASANAEQLNLWNIWSGNSPR